jgi:hypothetical protein
LFLFKLGVQALGYFLSPSKNPFLVYGKLEGGTAVTISQNPANSNAIPIYRSNNEFSGAEFTWSVWLYLNLSPGTNNNKYNTIFVKGASSANGTTGIHVTNGPGLYTQCTTTGIGKLLFVFDDSGGKQNKIEVENVPLQKWVHVAFRLKNTVLDVYINGSINNRYQLKSAPKQNYYDTFIGDSNGFKGYISSLRYYGYAIGYSEIQALFASGPSLKMIESESMPASSDYLSINWYFT